MGRKFCMDMVEIKDLQSREKIYIEGLGKIIYTVF